MSDQPIPDLMAMSRPFGLREIAARGIPEFRPVSEVIEHCPICDSPLDFAKDRLTEVECRNQHRFALLAENVLKPLVAVMEMATAEADLMDPGPVTLYNAGDVVGEMSASSIPVGRGIDVAALKEGDDDPYEVVVRIDAGKSKRGWNYTQKALQKYVGEVMNGGLPGYKGHMKPEDLAFKFIDPATHWVGALVQGESNFFRGIVDRDEPKLKRQIRTRRVDQVSIYGTPHLQKVAGEIHVVDADPISIDWTPKKRAGMETRIVAEGEMDVRLGPGEEPVGEQKEEEIVADMTVEQLFAEARKLGVKPEQAIGEMGWTPEQVIKGLDGGFDVIAKTADSAKYAEFEKAVATVGEMAEVLGLGKDAKVEDIVSRAKEAKTAYDKQNADSHDQTVEKVIGEMVANEDVRPVVKDVLKVERGADEADIKKAVGEIMDKDWVKDLAARSRSGGTRVTATQDTKSAAGENGKQPEGLRPRSVSI